MAKQTRELECILDEEEKGSKAITASQKRHRALKLKEEASSLEKEAKALEEQVATGREKRPVECVEEKDFGRNEVRVVRCDERQHWPDGDHVVETRAMTGEERQTLIGEDLGVTGSKRTRLRGKKDDGGESN